MDLVECRAARRRFVHYRAGNCCVFLGEEADLHLNKEQLDVELNKCDLAELQPGAM